jgi:hypothetical protein
MLVGCPADGCTVKAALGCLLEPRAPYKTIQLVQNGSTDWRVEWCPSDELPIG